MPTDPAHPRSTAAALGGAIAILALWGLTSLGAHPSPEQSAAITTLFSYLSSLIPSS